MNRKLHLGLILLIFLLLFVEGLGFFLFTFNLIIGQTRTMGNGDIDQIVFDLNRNLIETGKPGFQETVKIQKELIPARIIIVDEDSRLLADSSKRDDEINGKYINANIIDAKRQGSALNTIQSLRTRNVSVSVARELSIGGMSVIVSLEYLIGEERQMLILMAILVGSQLILIVLQIYFITAYVSGRARRPMKKLIMHTREAVAGGFFKIDIRSSDDELNELVKNFNSLIDRYNLLIEADNRKYSRINTLLSNLHTGILMIDSENRVTLVNPETERLLHLDKLELFGIRKKSGEVGDILSRILLESIKVYRTGMGTEFSETSPSGEIIDITIEMMRNKYEPYEPTGSLVILRDVTEIRKMERLKDEFVSNVSHELRTPLTVISGFVETLQNWEILDREERTTALNIIEVETSRLKKLISELLLLSRIQGDMGQMKRQLIDCAEAVEQVVTILRPLAEEKDQNLEVVFTEGAPTLRGVAGWFRQIVYNITGNAIKYTPAGGTVLVGLSQDDDDIILEVSDTGTGIPESEREMIFERFYRRDKSHNSNIPGSGIGLTITKHMVTELEGDIEVNDRPGGGSVFTVRLPRSIN